MLERRRPVCRDKRDGRGEGCAELLERCRLICRNKKDGRGVGMHPVYLLWAEKLPLESSGGRHRRRLSVKIQKPGVFSRGKGKR